MNFIFDDDKNQKLFKQRGVTFEQAIEIIASDGVLLDFKHPNSEQYSNQRVMVIAIENYPYCIPYIMADDTIVLKTIFPDRRFKYLLEEKDES